MIVQMLASHIGFATASLLDGTSQPAAVASLLSERPTADSRQVPRLAVQYRELQQDHGLRVI